MNETMSMKRCQVFSVYLCVKIHISQMNNMTIITLLASIPCMKRGKNRRHLFFFEDGRRSGARKIGTLQ